MTTLRMTFTGFLLLSISILVSQVRGASSWIWHAEDPAQEAPNAPRYFRYTFELPSSIQSAVLKMSSDNAGTAYLNGKQVGKCRDWQRPMEVTVSSQVESGLNVLAIRAIAPMPVAEPMALGLQGFGPLPHAVPFGDSVYELLVRSGFGG